MSTLNDIEFAAITMPGRQETLRELIVSTLAYLFHEDVTLACVPIAQPDATTFVAYERDAKVWSGEEWDPSDNWLADMIAAGTDGKPVCSWAWGLTLAPGDMQVMTGFSADGRTESTGLAFGRPADVVLPEEAIAYFHAQARVLWGSAWQPLP